MTVLDKDDQKLGTVEQIQFGDEDLERPGAETQSATEPGKKENTLVDNIQEALMMDQPLPADIRARLLRYGFIKVDTGLVGSDCFVIADQIAGVTGDNVKLSVAKDDLIGS